MKKNRYGTEKYQKELLKLMKEVHQFCEKNCVRYSLAGGTLLGAIRHNGFIPWDDDLDLMFDRRNYEKFIDMISRTGGETFALVRDKWVVRVEYSDNRGGIGSWKPSIDLFINDAVPEKTIKYKYKVFALKTLQGMIKEDVDLNEYAFFYRICLVITHLMGKAFSDERKYSAYQRISQIGNSENAQYVASYNDVFRLLTVKYSGKLMESLEKHIFEDTELWVTKQYDNYLSLQYGDYMTPPPKEEQVPAHL